MKPISSSHDTVAAPPVAHIVSTPGTCGGKPRIAGTRIRVQDIVVWHEVWGLSPEEIVTDYPQLTLAQIHAALAYYHDHREDIRREMHEADARVDAFKQQYPSHVFELRSRDPQGDHAPLPPG